MHRSLTLKTFCHDVPWDDLHGIEAQFHISPPNDEASGAIREDFSSINEITNLLGDCYHLA